MLKPESPCLNCEHRSTYCHAKCSQYMQFVDDNQKYKDLILEEKKKGCLATNLTDKQYKQYLKNKQHKFNIHHN